jgi:DNA-binding transcriptional MocR family regulator
MNYKYTEIMDYLRREIDRSTFKGKLPSIRGLAIKFSCSNSTVIKAYDELETLGLVFSAPKSGYFISSRNFKNELDFDFFSGVPSNSLLPFEALEKTFALVMKENNPSLMNYSYPNGYNLLREYLHKEIHNGVTTLDGIFVTPGTQSAINMIVTTTLKGDTLLIEDPSYNLVLEYMKIADVRFQTVAREIEGIDMDSFREKVEAGGIRYFLTNTRNHNPLGTDLSAEQILEIAELSRTFDFYIIENDYLGDLNRGDTFFSLAPDRTIYIKGFSKTISPSLRLSFMAVPPELVKAFSHNITFASFSPSLLNQAVLLKFMKTDLYAKSLNQLREKIKQNIIVFRSAISGFPYRMSIPEAGYFAYLEFPDDFKLSLLMDTMQSKGYVFRDLHEFTLDEDRKALRISLVRVGPDRINEAIRELVKEVISMNDRKRDKNRIFI